ncbi:hypothetical protein [Gottfriedia acidiceleris]|uniref:Uncharacterized protein n=1 Tax=Gottfriedia acidiceleris TaxID=371036 RepID=A0ABY4JKU6_9BACI|nr:hypothetical protein [Gottfriedia acidiceleris]UPM53680.1 hypothetical protein MY490_18140 [Gottfriedia acidiceleris]
MEKDIRKGLIYGFLFGVAIAILFIKHYEIVTNSDGNEINYLSIFDYLIIILKRGIVGSFSGAMIAFIIFKLNSSLKLTKKMKLGGLIFGLCVVGPVIQYLVSLKLNELLLFN